MLIRFSTENFLSYKNNVEFSMAAGKITRHSSHNIEKSGKRILKGGAIFGANASGKSNFIHAVDFAKNIVVRGLTNTDCDRKYFRLDESYKNKPGVFQFDIYSNGHFYSYGFAISYIPRKIEEEWLYEIASDEKCLFLRSQNDEGKMEFKSDIKFSDNSKLNRFMVYSDDIITKNMDQTLFLSDIVLRSPDEDFEYQPFRDVREWFNNIIILYPDTKYRGITQYVEEDETCSSLEALLKYFDTGIVSVEKVDIEFDKAFSKLPQELTQELKADLITELSDKSKQVVLKLNGQYVEIHLENGMLIASSICANHGNDLDLFDYEDESDGTKRLFDLIPLFSSALKNKVILIDELDRSLHTKVASEFIRYFYEFTEGCASQLIVTTHDSNILDLDLLRQDEIWFVERGEDHSSKLFSFNKFRMRFDKKIEKDYLLGRYGAIPIFDRSNLCADKEGDECAEQ